MLYLCSVTGSACGIFTVGLLHVAWRTCLLAEELYHIPLRYQDKKSAARKAYRFNMKFWCACSISALAIVVRDLKYVAE